MSIKPLDGFFSIPLSLIKTKAGNQTRPAEDNKESDLQLLADGIKANGQHMPIIVYRESEESKFYVVLDGHRRFAALQMIGAESAKCEIRLRKKDGVDRADAANSLQRTLGLGAVLAKRIADNKAGSKSLAEYAKEYGRSLGSVKNLMSAWNKLADEDKELAVSECWTVKTMIEKSHRYDFPVDPPNSKPKTKSHQNDSKMEPHSKKGKDSKQRLREEVAEPAAKPEIILAIGDVRYRVIHPRSAAIIKNPEKWLNSLINNKDPGIESLELIED
jgi:ParB/RepB/Spo0J family partition protein